MLVCPFVQDSYPNVKISSTHYETTLCFLVTNPSQMFMKNKQMKVKGQDVHWAQETCYEHNCMVGEKQEEVGRHNMMKMVACDKHLTPDTFATRPAG